VTIRKTVESHRYKLCGICLWCSIGNACGVVFQTLIIAPSSVVVKSVFKRSNLKYDIQVLLRVSVE